MLLFVVSVVHALVSSSPLALAKVLIASTRNVIQKGYSSVGGRFSLVCHFLIILSFWGHLLVV